MQRPFGRGAIEFLEDRGLLGQANLKKTDVFEFFGVNRNAGYRMIQSDEVPPLETTPPAPRKRKHKHAPTFTPEFRKRQRLENPPSSPPPETPSRTQFGNRNAQNKKRDPRGRPRAYGAAEVQQMVDLFKAEPYEAHRFGYQTLAANCGLKVHDETTIRAAFKEHNYHMCLDKAVKTITESQAAARAAHAQDSRPYFATAEQSKM